MILDETTVYTAYGPGGLCLYVGVAGDFARRKEAHLSTSAWAPYVTQWGTVQVPSRDEALEVETLFIRQRKPLFNIAKNPHRVPDPYGVLLAAIAETLSPAARALREKYQADRDELAYSAAATSLWLGPVLREAERIRATTP